MAYASPSRASDRQIRSETQSRQSTKLSWGAALSLAERIQCGSGQAIYNHATGRSRLQTWRSQMPFEQPALFDRKLTALNMDESQLQHILSLPEQELEQAQQETPEWVQIFEQAYENYADAPLLFPNNPNAEIDFSLLLIIANPLLTWGLQRLRNHIAELSTSDSIRYESSLIERICLDHLRYQLAKMIARTASLELNIARLENTLQGDTSQQRYENFFLSLREPQTALKLWQEYPILARQIVQIIQTRIDAVGEFLLHLNDDWSILEEQFASNGQLGLLHAISLNQGDAHSGGKGVIIAYFESGTKIVYKPRSLQVEVSFQNLLNWLNQQGAQPAFRILSVVDRGHHGWVEFVQHHGCIDDHEIERFYRRMGNYTALFYALQANDFHAQNLVAAGEHPVAIDLETLFNPSWGQNNAEPILRLLRNAWADSVIKIGLLPQKVWSSDDHDGIDLSGIGGGTAQVAPEPTLCWAEPGTDRMHITRDQFMIPDGKNRPTLKQQNVSPYPYRHALHEGFENTYRLIMNVRDQLIHPSGPLNWFNNATIRVVLRDTRTYVELLEESFHPDFLRDALNRDQLFDRLWLRTLRETDLQAVVEAEHRDLREHDVPLFTTQPHARDLWTSRGERIPEFFDHSGLAVVKQRLALLSEQDLSRQLWLLDASLATLQTHQPKAQPLKLVSSEHQQQATSPVSNGQLLHAASSVADRLVTLAVKDSGLATWFSKEYRGDYWALELVGPDLYDGLAGITLFLAQIGAISGTSCYTELAQEACATLEAYAREDSYQLPSIGGFTGWGGGVIRSVAARPHLAACRSA